MGTSGYDGSVTVKADIDPSDFNKGLKNLTASISRVGASFKALGAAVVNTVSIMAALAGVAITAALGAMVGAISLSIRKLFDLEGYAQSLKVSFENLKLAFATAFEPLVSAAIPIIMTVVNWMTKMLQTVQMYIAAFLGQKSILVATTNSATGAAKATGQMARNTKDAEKAARGALASFDEINVLQQENKEDSNTGGAGPDVAFQTVPVENSVIETVGKIQKWFADTWKSISDGATAAWNWILSIWGPVSAWFSTYVITPLMAGFDIAWKWLTEAWGNAGQWFQDNFIGPVGQQFNELVNTLIFCGQEIYSKVILPLVGWFETFLWPVIQKIIGFIVEIFKAEFDLIVKNLAVAWDLIVAIFQNAFIWIGNILTGAMQIFQGLIEFLTGVFTANWGLAWKGIQDIAAGTWQQIYGTVKLIVNSLIDLVNGMVAAMVNGLNTMIGGLNSIHLDIPDAITKLLGITSGKWSMNIGALPIPAKIPHLATGAVIPANAPFAAVLGDQRSGKNIEAPVSLLNDLFDEKLSALQGEMNITMPVYLDSEKIFEGQKRVQQRRGTSFVTAKAGA